MISELKYEIKLRNTNLLEGKIKVRIGEEADSVKERVLRGEGFKDFNSFFADHPTINIEKHQNYISIVQKADKSSLNSQPSSRKGSSDLFEEVSIDLDNQSLEFLQKIPQQPPTVRGPVQKPYKIFSCLSTTYYLELKINELRFYTINNHKEYEGLDDTIFINDVKFVRSYRKKDYFFLKLVLENDSIIDLRFSNKFLCKEWMGYIIQALSFCKYLCEKQTYSKKQSFKGFLKALQTKSNENIVYLDLNLEKHETSLFKDFPDEKQHEKQIKSLIKLSEFQITYKIGSGSFSLVFLAKKNSKIYALKQLSKEKLLSKNQMKYAMTELNVLKGCRKCKYIIPLSFAFQTEDYLYLALKYISGGDLDQLIKKRGKLSQNEALILLAELIFAIQFLHSKKILYRDIKPENILIDKAGHLYLTDFGLSKQLTQEQEIAESFLGTPLYLAPERFQGSGGIDYRSDIYGAGCIFYEMLHGEKPFPGSDYYSVIYKIKNNDVEIDQSLPESYKKFLQQTLEKDPAKRLTNMREHEIFKNINWKALQKRTHKGIEMQSQNLTDSIISGVQINYKIDEDYNENNYPNKKIAGWQFSVQQQPE